MTITKKIVIDDRALAFFRTLKKSHYPKTLIEQFPRIANHVYDLRNDKASLGKYFESLLTDERRGRRGFPFPVLAEIQSLYDDLVGIPGSFNLLNIHYVGSKRND